MGDDAERDEMNEHPRNLDRETAEQLLGGASATRIAGAERLAGLLRSAAAPARPGELAGENAALMAFRSERTEPTSRVSFWRRLVTFKAAAVAVVAVTAGGLAFASTTGIIPSPFKVEPFVQSPQSSSAATPDGSRHTPGSGAPSAMPSALVDEAVAGLCRAFLNKPPAERGKALETPAYSALVTAAGGADKVEAYCTAMAEAKPDKSQSPKPAKPSDVRTTRR